MKDNRRIRRMEQNNRKGRGIAGLGLNLIPMMDILCVLVFFLLFHSFNGDIQEARIALPDSVVEARPRKTVAIVVSPDFVLVQGEPVISTPKLYNEGTGTVHEITERLEEIEQKAVGISADTAPENKEVTLLADKTIPFKVLKKIMSTCTDSGYGRISLAVIQKTAQG